MSPDEMLASLENWIQVCKDQRQKARMRKLQAYRETLQGMIRPQDPTQLHQAVAERNDFMNADPLPPVEKSWRDKAREYGIPMWQRKKSDVEVDIEAHEAELAKQIQPALEGADAPDG